MKKIIGFVCGVSQSYRLMHSLGTALEKDYSVEPLYIYFQENAAAYLRHHDVDEGRMINPHENLLYGNWAGESVDMEYLLAAEKKYGIPNLWLMWETIRTHSRNHTHYDALKLLEKTFKAYEKLVANHRMDAVITHVYPGTIPSFAMTTVFSDHHVPVYTIFPHRMKGRFVIYTGYKDQYAEVDRIFADLQGRDLTPEERIQAESFLTEFREKKYLSTQEGLLVRKKEFGKKRILRAFTELLQAYRFKTYRTYRQTNPLGPLIYYKTRLRSMINKRILNRSGLFEMPDFEEKYVLFFLHKQPENSTLGKAPFYLDQVSLILNISKSLPIDCRLYVKPHHNDFGNQKTAYYKALSQRPNIRLLKLSTNGHELIRRCRMVITITGSVGWEGILFEKPVLTFGNVFYNSFPQVKQVDDIRRLPDYIRQGLEEYEPDHELLLKYITAHKYGSYEGTPIAPVLDEETSLNRENIARLSRGIARALGLAPAEP